jgi:2-phospho-L-lactate guanylyltransferase
VRWTVVIPARSLPGAKSRLVDASHDATGHARLVHALRTDTIAAADATPDVARIVLVVDDLTAVSSAWHVDEVVVQREPGLNAAVSQAAERAEIAWPDDGVAVLVGDLPALRPHELSAALALAAQVERGFVADHTGTGTTLLTARPGVPVRPAFGPGSARRHESSATALAAARGLRLDVDTAADLFEALAMGVGPATLTASRPGPPRTTLRVHLGAR